MKKIQSGFTLIELMIVVAIIGILAAIAIPQYQNYIARTQASEGLVLASAAKTAVAEYANVKGAFPATDAVAGALIDAMAGKYVASVVVTASGLITATFDGAVGCTSACEDSHAKIAGKTLILTPSGAGGGAITWTCTAGTVSDAYLPSSCK